MSTIIPGAIIPGRKKVQVVVDPDTGKISIIIEEFKDVAQGGIERRGPVSPGLST
jgi:hypothetical protein